MPEYDAFGREIGEDTLSGLGSGAAAGPAPDGGPAPPAPPRTEGSPLRADPASPTPPQPPAFTAAPQPPRRPSVSIPIRPPRPRRRRRGLGIVVLFVLFVFLAPLVIGAVALFNTVDNATNAVRGGIIKAIPTATAQAAAPKGIAGRSLVRRDHFAAALRKLSSSELRLTSLHLAPERINAQLLTRGGRLRHVQVQPGGAVEQFGSDSGPGFDTATTIPFSRLDPRAPQRLAQRGAAKLRVKVSTLKYLVPTRFSGKIMWAAYFEHGRYVLGDGAGRYQRSYP